jgi:hypothetical protein
MMMTCAMANEVPSAVIWSIEAPCLMARLRCGPFTPLVAAPPLALSAGVS